MKVMISLGSEGFYYHGSKKKFSKFSEYRPAFFSKNIEYAKAYGDIIAKVKLDIRHVFDTRTDKRAVEIFNDYFLKSGLARDRTKPMKLGEPVHFNDADELWSYLAIPEYPAPHYDGIVVSEGNLEKLNPVFKNADLAYVPLSTDQIHIVGYVV